MRVAGKNIAEASELSIRAALGWFAEVLPQLTPQRQEIAGRILRESSIGCNSWSMSGWII